MSAFTAGMIKVGQLTANLAPFLSLKLVLLCENNTPPLHLISHLEVRNAFPFCLVVTREESCDEVLLWRLYAEKRLLKGDSTSKQDLAGLPDRNWRTVIFWPKLSYFDQKYLLTVHLFLAYAYFQSPRGCVCSFIDIICSKCIADDWHLQQIDDNAKQ